MTTQDLLKMVQTKEYFKHHHRVLVAVSGGADSMSLLHFLYHHQKELDIDLAIAHVNHKQRLESEKEEAYLREWAKEHNLPFFSSDFKGRFSENKAREFRYAFFKQIMQENAYSALVTAHHADDQAETVLMRLIRGGRLRHLRGIQAVRPFAGGELIRPFLALSKGQLPETFHFEDISNSSKTYLRNRVRLDYLPQLSEENPKFSQHLRDLATDITLFEQAFTDLTRDIDKTHLPSFQKQSPAVQTLLLESYLEDYPTLHLSRGQFKQVLTYLQSPHKGQLCLKKGYFLVKDKERFTIQADQSLTLSSPKLLEKGQECLFDDYMISFSALTEQAVEGILIWSPSPILIRHRQEGDKIDFGNHHKKIRRLFIDHKISPVERQKAIIGEQDGKIIFIKVAGRLYLKKKPENAILYGIVAINQTF